MGLLKISSFLLFFTLLNFMTGSTPTQAAQPPGIPGVTGGPFGNSTQVGQFTVKDGKVIGASNVNISLPANLPPSGPAGGDLSGNYPNPTLKNGAVTSDKLGKGAVTNLKISSDSASEGSVLTADGAGGTNWSTPTDNNPATAFLDPNELEIALFGDDFALTEIAAIQGLPAGNYTITAKLTTRTDAATLVICNLSDGSNTELDRSAVTFPSPEGFLPPTATVSLASVRENPGDILLSCGHSNSNTHPTRLFVTLIASKVSAIHCAGGGCQEVP